MQTVNYLHIVFASQASLGAVLLINQSRFKGLVALLISATCLMLFNLNEELNIFVSWPLITPAFVLLNGPLWYFFVRQLTGNKSWRPQDWLHLTPAVLGTTISASWPQTIIFVGTLSQFIYIYCAIKLVKQYHQLSKQQHSDAHDMQIKWVVHVMSAIVFVSVIDLIRLNSQQSLSNELAQIAYLLTQLLYLMVFVYLIYQAINQPALFNGLQQDFSPTKPPSKTNPIDQPELEKRKKQFAVIDQYIQDHLLFLQPRLSIRTLSEQCGMTEKEISQAINHVDDLNFCDYINGMRIEHFKQVLTIHSNILQTALDCGFNSKSSFNAVFKKATGLTPSQFQKSKT